MTKKQEETEVKNDWIMKDAARAAFWAQVKEHLGHFPDSHEAAHNACGVTSMKLYEGTLQAALADVVAFGIADREYRMEKALEEALAEKANRLIGLAEAPASLNFCGVTSKGWQIQVTIRDVDEGKLVERFGELVALLTVMHVNPCNRDGDPILAAQSPSDPSQAAGEQLVQAEFIKITAPEGKPVIEFWRPNRKYRELAFNLPATAFFGLPGAEQLTAAGWTAEHFTVIGQQYTIPLNVFWVKSPKSPADKVWKDIVRIEMR